MNTANKAKKLLNRPIEPETTILMENIVEFKTWDIEVLMELWFWDGITASSFVFLKEDIGNLSDIELINKIKLDFDSIDLSDATIKASGDYVYVNYGFKVGD